MFTNLLAVATRKTQPWQAPLFPVGVSSALQYLSQEVLSLLHHLLKIQATTSICMAVITIIEIRIVHSFAHACIFAKYYRYAHPVCQHRNVCQSDKHHRTACCHSQVAFPLYELCIVHNSSHNYIFL